MPAKQAGLDPEFVARAGVVYAQRLDEIPLEPHVVIAVHPAHVCAQRSVLPLLLESFVHASLLTLKAQQPRLVLVPGLVFFEGGRTEVTAVRTEERLGHGPLEVCELPGEAH